MTCIHERNKREVWFLTSSQVVWDDAQLQEKIRKNKFKKFLDFRRELTFWLCSTNLISAHIQRVQSWLLPSENRLIIQYFGLIPVPNRNVWIVKPTPAQALLLAASGVWAGSCGQGRHPTFPRWHTMERQPCPSGSALGLGRKVWQTS